MASRTLPRSETPRRCSPAAPQQQQQRPQARWGHQVTGESHREEGGRHSSPRRPATLARPFS